MVLQVEGLRRFNLSVQALKARIEGQVTSAYRNYVRTVFGDLVAHTPQFSGHLTANWNVLLTNEAVPAVVQWYKKDDTGTHRNFTYRPSAMGDGEAMHAAIERAEPKIERIRWNTKVTFANPVPYAEEVEDNPGRLRPVNLASGKEIMVRYVVSKYSRGETLLWRS